MIGPSRAAWLLWKLSIALVWFYQGLWHKVLSPDDRHRRIIAEALGDRIGPPACIALGLFETALAFAVIVEFRPRLTAIAQIGLLIGMNGAGLLFAGRNIPDPFGMITMNFAFAMSIALQASFAVRRKP
ncbi:hypothetical protein AYO49_04260 [Verrucomicrobiaceae bacterium SCGC AG-212-N21]|nr:hypothetical protein AYO49_04260 [Verrucomicrobiaceae bacterium SCGC AG-212-N21]